MQKTVFTGGKSSLEDMPHSKTVFYKVCITLFKTSGNALKNLFSVKWLDDVVLSTKKK